MKEKKLKIKAPVSSLELGMLQIESGANELYCGYDNNFSTVWTLSGRFRKSVYTGNKTELSIEDFEKLVNIAHKNNVEVELVANIPWLPDLDDKQTAKKIFVDYAKRGVEMGVDRIIVSDIGNILALRDANIKTPITASTFMAVINQASIHFLEDLGVSKIVLPHQISIEEISDICNCTDLAIEVFGQFGCAFLEAACGMLHRYDEKTNLGLPCRALYSVNNKNECPALDVASDCSLCNLSTLMKTGVQSVKIIGRDMEPGFISSITYVYRLAIDFLHDGGNPDELLSMLRNEVDFTFWEDTFCKNSRCKYNYEPCLI